MKSEILLTISIILGIFLQDCMSHINGAPESSCMSFRPTHGSDFSRKVDWRDFFELTTTPTEFGDNSIKVTLTAKQKTRIFQGFLIKAVPGMFDPNNWEDQPLPIGNWREDVGVKTLNCQRGDKNALTHSDDSRKTEASFIWTPPTAGENPEDNPGVSFVATVVERKSRYFFGVASDLVDLKPINPTVPEVATDTTDPAESDDATDTTDSEVAVDTTDSEVAVDTTDSEVAVDTTDSEVAVDTTDSEVAVETTDSEVAVDTTDPEVATDPTTESE